MGSSAQNSSGVHWRRRRVRKRFPRFRRRSAEPGYVQQGFQGRSGRVWCRARSSSKKIPASLGAKPSQVQKGSREGSGEGSGEGWGVLWCKARSASTVFRKVPEKVWEASVQSRVWFNRVPEKVPVKVWEALVHSQVEFNRVPAQGSGEGSAEGLGGFSAKPGSTGFQEALVQSQVNFNEVPEKVPKVPEKVWEALVQSQVRFSKVPENVSGLWCRARSGSTGTGEGLGSFVAKTDQVQQGSGETSAEGEGSRRLGCRARSGSTNRVPKKVPGKVWEALVQSQVRFNRVPEKVPEKFWEALAGQVQQGSGRFREVPGSFGAETRFRRRSERLWYSQVRCNSVPEKVPRESLAGFGADPEKVPENIPGILGAQPSQVQRVSEKIPEKA